ncbi:MAG TPA: sugar phosphate nucleotidyltransferase [Bdellovibrionota bacterium]|nr:sugar phosphate nucleotidyltransferase [Bdellovibrionota bacterium]
MLMAAGLGTRLRPFTLTRTKALMPVMGVPVAQFAIDAAVAAGVRHLVANVHHLADQAIAGLRALERGEAGLEISDERELLLGSAGGYRKALPLLGSGPFLALNADVLCDVDLSALFRAHRRLRRSYGVSMTLAVLRAAPAGEMYRRIVVDADSSLVTGFGAELEASPPFWAGAAVIEPEAIAGVPDGKPSEFVPMVLQPAVERRRVGAFVTSGHWHDIGSPELWLRTHLSLIEGLETGRIPALWRRRIERASRRIAHGQWISMSSGRSRGDGWTGPCYFGGERAPRELGPGAIDYGWASLP